jgi:hypothetical protein
MAHHNKIFFFHNPKAGGTTFRSILDNRFAAEKRCPLIENNKVEHDALFGDYERFHGYDRYAGYKWPVFRLFYLPNQ